MNAESCVIKIPSLKKKFTLLHISDAHIIIETEHDSDKEKALAKRQNEMWSPLGILPKDAFAEMAEYVTRVSPDALVMSGDCVDYYTKESVEFLKDTVAKLPCDVLYVYGNHEGASYFEEICDTKIYYGEYESCMNGNPLCWSKDFEGFRVVGIDNSVKKITAEQLSFVKEKLSDGIPVVLIMHVPIYTESLRNAIEKRWGEGTSDYFAIGKGRDDDETTQEFIELVKGDENICAVLAGHTHAADASEISENKMQYVAAPCFERYIRHITLEP